MRVRGSASVVPWRYTAGSAAAARCSSFNQYILLQMKQTSLFPTCALATQCLELMPSANPKQKYINTQKNSFTTSRDPPGRSSEHAWRLVHVPWSKNSAHPPMIPFDHTADDPLTRVKLLLPCSRIWVRPGSGPGQARAKLRPQPSVDV